MAEHAKLSASGSHRWLACSGSVKATEHYPNTSSIYAIEGTRAHEVADLCLTKDIDADFYLNKKVNDTEVDGDMTRFVQEYLDYVRSFETSSSTLYTEERVNFSNIVPEGFGTMDAAVLDGNHINIFDLKYGRGVEVSAQNNSQARLYALGMLNELSFLGDITHFSLHIVQPRKYHIDVEEITTKELIEWGEWVKERATLALKDDAKREPGEKQCQWCDAKGDCKALLDYTTEIISAEFEDLETISPDSLTDEQKRRILDNAKLIESFIASVSNDVFSKIEQGDNFKGYKLVEGRSVRKWTPDAEDYLVKELKDDAYTTKLINITTASKLLGKSINDYTIKPQGKTVLAKESDKRKALGGVADDFEII